MKVIIMYRDGKIMEVIAKKTGIPKSTVEKIYRMAINKSINLQIYVDNLEIYQNLRGRS